MVATTQWPADEAPPPESVPVDYERHTVQALADGDESAFRTLIDRHASSMQRLARLYVADDGAAEEVCQETWLAVLQGIGRFEGRSSLRTWIYRILVNRAKTRGVRDGRFISLTDLGDAAVEDDEPAVDPGRFRSPGEPYAGGWREFPRPWPHLPEDHVLSQEMREQIEVAIQALAPGQRTVIWLRDVEGWSAAEVCNVLGLSETNQRVLLHRARSKVRGALESYLGEDRR
jgi:RNA polymerase sigma-70 factor, ECF subfamily